MILIKYFNNLTMIYYITGSMKRRMPKSDMFNLSLYIYTKIGVSEYRSRFPTSGACVHLTTNQMTIFITIYILY